MSSLVTVRSPPVPVRVVGVVSRSRLRATAFALASVVALVVGAACSGDDDSATGTPSSSTAASTTTTTSAPVPGAEWDVVAPETVGLDPAALQQVATTAEAGKSNCLVVVRDGKIAGEWYFRGTNAETTQNVFSMTKSVVEHVGRHRPGRRRPRHQRSRVHVDHRVEGHTLRRGHGPGPAEQRLGPRVEPRHRLRAAAPSARSHRVRDRAHAGRGAGHGLGVQQLGDPDVATCRAAGDRHAGRRLRATAPLRAARDDEHAHDHRPGRQRADVPGCPDQLPRHGAIRRADAQPREVGRGPSRVLGLGRGGDGQVLDRAQRRRTATCGG